MSNLQFKPAMELFYSDNGENSNYIGHFLLTIRFELFFLFVLNFILWNYKMIMIIITE